MKRIVGLSLLAAGLALSAAPASARDGENAAAAVIGGIAGFALGTALAAPPPPPPVYVRRPARVVVEEEAYEEPVCVIRRTRTVDEFGDVTVRRTKVCD
jgi:hypothetical protein